MHVVSSLHRQIPKVGQKKKCCFCFVVAWICGCKTQGVRGEMTFTENNFHVCWPTQFKPVLFKGQWYINIYRSNKYIKFTLCYMSNVFQYFYQNHLDKQYNHMIQQSHLWNHYMKEISPLTYMWVASFTMVRDMEITQVSIIHEWIKNMWCTCTMEYWTTREKEILPLAKTRLDLEMICQGREIGQDKYCFVWPTCGRRKKNLIKYRAEWRWVGAAGWGNKGAVL